MKKVISILTILIMLGLATTVYATSESIKVWSDGHTFDKAWEACKDGINCTFVYGYNTTWINEDYVHAKHNSLYHKAALVNGNGSHSASAKAGKWAKIEVRHKGSRILYGIVYYF
ncbi:hypothetical protein [Haloimpatiens massiliensis]|uniref:mediterrocin family bacteriocin n=1 Tax=Haloimpatiens massiliensis TaxID=1658110 RepID=UPI000C855C96|nr:hypothetical protein [Haloimpatiens massiliensis]